MPVGDPTALDLGRRTRLDRVPAGARHLRTVDTPPAPRTHSLACAAAALAAAEWEPDRAWQTPGNVLLFDSAWPGKETDRTDHLRVELAPGRYAVRAAYVEPGPETWVGLVQLRRLTD